MPYNNNQPPKNVAREGCLMLSSIALMHSYSFVSTIIIYIAKLVNMSQGLEDGGIYDPNDL